MSEPLVQITLSLSETVVEQMDELLAEVGMQSRGAFIDSLLREVLFYDEQSEASDHLAKVS